MDARPAVIAVAERIAPAILVNNKKSRKLRFFRDFFQLSKDEQIIAMKIINPPNIIFTDIVSVPAITDATAVTTAENGIIIETTVAERFFIQFVRIIQQIAEPITT